MVRLITLCCVLTVIIAVLLISRVDGAKPYPAWIGLGCGDGCQRVEPPQPGYVYSLDGCGYLASDIWVTDSVIYQDVRYPPWAYGDPISVPFDPTPYVGQTASVTVNVGPPDANGCSRYSGALWWQAWGVGTHILTACQFNKRGICAVRTQASILVWPHDTADKRYCLFYAPPPVSPLVWWSCP